MHKSIFILVTLFSSGVCYAQDLFQLYDSARKTGDLTLAEKVIELAVKEENDKLLADTYFLIGYYKKQDEQFYDAVINYYESIRLSRKSGDLKKMISAIENTANIYSMSGFKNIAFEHYYDVIKLKRQLGDSLGLAITHFNIGKLYTEMNEYDSAMLHYQQQLELAERIGSKRQTGLAYNAIGIIYRYKNDFQLARSNYSLALKSNNIPEMQGHFLNNVGSSFLYEGDTASAIGNYTKALSLTDSLLTETISKIYVNLASIYESRNVDSARYFYENSFRNLEKRRFTLTEDYLFTCAKLMGLYRGSHPDKALAYGDKLAEFATEQIKLKEQLKNLNKRYQVEAATWKIENDKKAEKLAEQNLILIYIIIGLLVSMAVLVFLYIANRRKKKELEYYTINTKRLYEVINS